MSTAPLQLARTPGSPALARLAVLRHIDYGLLGLVLTAALAGLIVLSGAVNGVSALESAASRQLTFLWISLAALAAATLIDYRWINRMALLIYVFNIGALVFVLAAGTRINGAKSWIALGPLNFQPSETMKIATVLVCAQWVALRPESRDTWKGIIVPGIICGIPALLVLMQPDLGTASLFFLLYLAMMLMSGASKKRLGMVLLAAIIGSACAFPFLKPYQQARLTSFINPEADAAGAGYNVIQSKIAVGAGGLLGEGWGQGTQGTHRFLPEHHTDFIFASAVEQFGFLGGIALLSIFLMIVLRMLGAMDKARDRFGGIVVAGLTAIFAGHVMLNIGMTVGLLPVTGIPLPFLSYGGSFLVTTFILFGLVLNVASRRFTFVGL